MNNKLERSLKEGVLAHFILIIPSFADLRSLSNIKQEISTASFSSCSNMSRLIYKVRNYFTLYFVVHLIEKKMFQINATDVNITATSRYTGLPTFCAMSDT
jgi:hypothetical protein